MAEGLDPTLRPLICRAERKAFKEQWRCCAFWRPPAKSGLGLTEISMHAELTRPTTHRILSVLVAEGIVEQRQGTRRYVVGEQISLLALSRRTRDPLFDIVSPHLRAAVGVLGDTGFFTRRVGLETVCVARQLTTYPVQALAWDVGDRRPLGVSNAGIAILSGMETGEARDVRRQEPIALLAVRRINGSDLTGGGDGPSERLCSARKISHPGGKPRIRDNPISLWRTSRGSDHNPNTAPAVAQAHRRDRSPASQARRGD